MAFFSDARDLTRSLTESTKLRAWVKEEERQTQENLLELGKQYYALHRDDPEAPLRDLVNALADSEIRVAQYWELIKEYECLVICDKCGTEMTQGTAVCVECGNPLPVSAPKHVFCARCGAQIVPGSRFCMNCGTPAPEVQIAPQFEPVDRVCGGCGAVLENGARFCMICGTPATGPKPPVESIPAAPAWEDDPYAENPYEESICEEVSYDEGAYEESAYEEDTYVEPVFNEQAVCDTCGAVLTEGMAFCMKCGTPVSAAAAVESCEEPAPNASDIQTCPVCGAIPENGIQFCTECGTRL